jgi:4-amino-4-deoxychorismate lyase
VESALYDRAGVQLIETLGWDGAAFARLPLHLARLAASAAQLGFACDLAQVNAALMGAAAQGAPARLRLTLDAQGEIAVQSAPIPPAKPIWTIGLAAQRLRANDPYLRVKSTHRPAYDAARAELPAGLDEVILLNERGEVCDGSITTLFFDRGHGLRTPPLSCGVLPGVLRAEMNAREETLYPADLPHLRLWVGNSLRGLIPARWVG